MAKKIQIRRGAATSWTTFDPVLSSGELGYDTTNKNFKVGDGSTIWSELDYTFTTEAYVDSVIGDIETILDDIIG
jgi:hypothetical protein